MSCPRIFITTFFPVVLFISFTLAGSQADLSGKYKKGGTAMELTSPAFVANSNIPARYTCTGQNISPKLVWSNIPNNTVSFALICDDPDAPGGTWVHWVAYNIPAAVKELTEGTPASDVLMNGTVQGINDFHSLGYGGPCPPSGTHRYFFKLYALDTMLSVSKGKTKTELLGDMRGHILAEAQLMGKYKK